MRAVRGQQVRTNQVGRRPRRLRMRGVQVTHTLKLVHCLDRPCCQDTYCQHPAADPPDDRIWLGDYERSAPPSWCPLRKGPTTVELADPKES